MKTTSPKSIFPIKTIAAIMALATFLPSAFSAELLINEVVFNDPNGSDRPGEYIELRGTPSATIPAGTYLVSIEGDEKQGAGAGDVQAFFDLSGLTIGSNGYLVILMESSPYTPDPNATAVYGTAGGTTGYPGAAGYVSDGLASLEDQSFTLFLIETATAPTLTDDIDGTDGGTANDGIPTGTIYDGWTILDSVAVADDTADGGTDVQSICYGDIIFVQDPAFAGLITEPGATIVDTEDVPIHYVARVGKSTGSTAAAWVGAGITGTAPDFILATGFTFPSSLEGETLDHVGSLNPGTFGVSGPVDTWSYYHNLALTTYQSYASFGLWDYAIALYYYYYGLGDFYLYGAFGNQALADFSYYNGFALYFLYLYGTAGYSSYYYYLAFAYYYYFVGVGDFNNANLYYNAYISAAYGG